jgi:hypothetical protein
LSGDELAELSVIRKRLADLEAALDRIPVAPPQRRGFVGVTTTIDSYPTSAQSYYAVIPQQTGGPEKEGGSASLTALSGTVFAANAGTSIPPEGTPVDVGFDGERHFFVY